MTSPIEVAQDQISADWSALVPEDRVTVRYREWDTKAPDSGVTDRMFVWAAPVRLGTISHAGGVSYVEWRSEVGVRFSADGRDPSALSAAAGHESQALAETAISRAAWPTGVVDVQVDSVTTSFLDDTDDVVATITFLIQTAESATYTYGDPLDPPDGGGIDPGDITALEDRMDDAEAAIGALDGRLDATESDIVTLEGRMDDAEDAIDALDGRLDTAESDINALDGRLDTAESDINALEVRATTLEAEVFKTLPYADPVPAAGYDGVASVAPTPANGGWHVALFELRYGCTFNRIVVETAAAAGNLDVCVFQYATGNPYDAGNVPLIAGGTFATAAGVNILALSGTLRTGFYYLAVFNRTGTQTVKSNGNYEPNYNIFGSDNYIAAGGPHNALFRLVDGGATLTTLDRSARVATPNGLYATVHRFHTV